MTALSILAAILSIALAARLAARDKARNARPAPIRSKSRPPVR